MSAPFRLEFDRARSVYLEGCHAEAETLFRALVARLDGGEEPGANLAVEALFFLAEIEMALEPAATTAFERFKRIAREYPDSRPNAIDHDPQALALYESARILIAATPKPPPPPPPPLPAWGYAPLGIPQFRQGRPALGTTFAVTQAALAVASFWSLAHAISEFPDVGDPDLIRRGTTFRVGVQWTTTAGFYGMWLASHLEARRHWRREHERSVGVAVLPTPDGARIGVTARF